MDVCYINILETEQYNIVLLRGFQSLATKLTCKIAGKKKKKKEGVQRERETSIECVKSMKNV